MRRWNRKDFNYQKIFNYEAQPAYRRVENTYSGEVDWNRNNYYNLQSMPLGKKDYIEYGIKYIPKMADWTYQQKRGYRQWAWDTGRWGRYNAPVIGRVNVWRWKKMNRRMSRIPYFRGRLFRYFTQNPYTGEWPIVDRIPEGYRPYKSYRPKKRFFDIFR